MKYIRSGIPLENNLAWCVRVLADARDKVIIKRMCRRVQLIVNYHVAILHHCYKHMSQIVASHIYAYI